MPTVACPHCSQHLAIPDEAAGSRVRCPKCQKVLVAPSSAALAVPPVQPQFVQPQFVQPQFVQPEPYPPPHQPHAGFRCPFCQTTALPRSEQAMSQAGIIVMIVLIICCFPLFWIPMISMKEEQRRCSQCGMKLG